MAKKEVRRMGWTMIRIDEEVWKKLNSKRKLGESYNDVLRRLLGLENGQEEKEE